MTDTHEARGIYAPIDEELGMDVLGRSAAGSYVGFRIVHATAETHLATVAVPAGLPENDQLKYLTDREVMLRKQVWPDTEAPELAWMSIEPEEASDLLRILKREGSNG